MADLYRTVGSVGYDNLISGLYPKTHVNSKTIRGLAEETTYIRGTVFAKSNVDNKLVILGTTAEVDESLVPDCILCDEVKVEASTDAIVAVYTAAIANENALIVKEGYTITETDKDKLRERGIYLGTVIE